MSQAAADDLAAPTGRLRRLEHRVQMIGDEQTHRLPEADPERRRVAALAGAGACAASTPSSARL